MSPKQYKKLLSSEIKKLNERIDFKILRGERYNDDSRRHRDLLRKLGRQRKKGLFDRFMPSMSLF